MDVLKLIAPDDAAWSRVGAAEIFVADLVDEDRAPDARMTVGFARVAKGEEHDISFPYDEVLVVTRGAYTVITETGQVLTARAGEVIYLPARSRNRSRAEEDAEIVYVASPPSVYAQHVAAAAAAGQAS